MYRRGIIYPPQETQNQATLIWASYDSLRQDENNQAFAYIRGHSGFLAGRGHKVETTTVEVDRGEEVCFLIAEAACGVIDPLDFGVEFRPPGPFLCFTRDDKVCYRLPSIRSPAPGRDNVLSLDLPLICRRSPGAWTWLNCNNSECCHESL